MFRMYDTDKNGYLDQVFCFLNPPPDDHDDNLYKMTTRSLSVCLSTSCYLHKNMCVCVCVCVCLSVCLFVRTFMQFPRRLYVCLSGCYEK